MTGPVALVGLKAYFSHARTLEWFEALCRLVEDGRADGLRLVVAPSATALASLAPRARELGIALAAQDCSRHLAGARTGELPASLLAEIGARYVEVGHVERRRLGDDDDVVAAKVRALVAAGLTPIMCVGEDSRSSPADAASSAWGQLEAALDGVPSWHEVMVAYEPTWAIGAATPAPSAYVGAVARELRACLERFPRASLLYGGTAGPGTYGEIADAVDGLGLGRRVHETADLAAVLDEMRAAPSAAERSES